MQTAIGSALKRAPLTLIVLTAVAASIVSLDVLLIALPDRPETLAVTDAAGKPLGTVSVPLPDQLERRNFRLTLAMIACFVVALVATRSPDYAAALGFRIAPRQGWLYWFWASAFLGLFLIVVLVITVCALGLPSGGGQPWSVRRFLSACLIAPVSEEIVYRLVLCPPAVAWLKAWGGILISGVVFAVAHILAGVASPDNQLGGFLLAWIFVKSETIVLPVALHALSNACTFLY
jgi:membrane protease YdiL (CAAX protease family)